MPRDSNGNASTDPVYVATPGTTIRAVQHNTPIADIIQMLTGSLARNGTGGMLADLAMGGFKITGLANGASAQDAVTKAQLDATLDDLPQLGAWTNVASASTVNLGAQASRNLVITGTTTITSFGTAGAADNVPYFLRFSGALTLTNGPNLILPGGANIVTAVGDIAIVIHDDAETWRIAFYSRAAMPPLIAGTSANNLVALDGTGKLPAVNGSLLTGIKTITAVPAIALSGQMSALFTGIPADARRLTLQLNAVSTITGESDTYIRLGTAGALVTSGYGSGACGLGAGVGGGYGAAGDGSGIYLLKVPANEMYTGIVTLTRVGTTNTWLSSYVFSRNLGANVIAGGGGITLPGPIDRLSLVSLSYAFDNGAVSLLVE